MAGIGVRQSICFHVCVHSSTIWIYIAHVTKTCQGMHVPGEFVASNQPIEVMSSNTEIWIRWCGACRTAVVIYSPSDLGFNFYGHAYEQSESLENLKVEISVRLMDYQSKTWLHERIACERSNTRILLCMNEPISLRDTRAHACAHARIQRGG